VIAALYGLQNLFGLSYFRLLKFSGIFRFTEINSNRFMMSAPGADGFEPRT